MSNLKPVFILSAPSTAGKNHILHTLKNTNVFDEMITMTTRLPRSGERKDIDYHFATHDEFEELLGNDGFVEYVKVPSEDSEKGFNYYGTPKASINDVFEKGKTPVVILEPEGAVELFNYLAKEDFLPTCVYLKADFSIGINRFARRIIDDTANTTLGEGALEKIINSYAQRIEAFSKEMLWHKVTKFDVSIGPSITEVDENNIKEFLINANDSAKTKGCFPWDQSFKAKPTNHQYLVRSIDEKLISRLSDVINNHRTSTLTSARSLSKAIRNELECNKLMKIEC